MFGIVRTVWSAMVVFGHIFWISDIGRYAVFGFYILSGYLMTYVMQNSYHFTTIGRKKFVTNRFLRLFPTYWFACLLSILLLISLTSYIHPSLFDAIVMPDSSISIFANITMIFPHLSPKQITPRLSPATWALTIELFYYVLIALGISKTLKRTYIWVAVSILYILFTFAAGFYWHSRYFYIPAGSLPFSLGALIFFLNKNEMIKYIPNFLLASPGLLIVIMLTLAFIAAWLSSRDLSIWVLELLFYINTIICFFIVLSLAKGKRLHNGITKKWDKFIGDFSYPFYLLHYQVAMLASFILYGQVSLFKYDISLISVLLFSLLLFIVSYLCIKIIDEPIEKLRQHIKNVI